MLVQRRCCGRLVGKLALPVDWLVMDFDEVSTDSHCQSSGSLTASESSRRISCSLHVHLFSFPSACSSCSRRPFLKCTPFSQVSRCHACLPSPSIRARFTHPHVCNSRPLMGLDCSDFKFENCRSRRRNYIFFSKVEAFPVQERRATTVAQRVS